MPSFLQKLHSQVNQRQGSINDKRRGDETTSEFDDLLGVASSSGPRTTEGGDDSDDEWDGAQVVVLKEGKHLSKEEIAATKTPGSEFEAGQATPASDGTGGQHVIAGVGAAPISRAKRRAPTSPDSVGMDEAKQLIAVRKGGESEEQMRKEKERKRAEKNKRARVEKAKKGKGLSFSMDE